MHEFYWEVGVEPGEVENRCSFVPMEESRGEGSGYTIRVVNGGEVGRAEELACWCTEVVQNKPCKKTATPNARKIAAAARSSMYHDGQEEECV